MWELIERSSNMSDCLRVGPLSLAVAKEATMISSLGTRLDLQQPIYYRGDLLHVNILLYRTFPD